MGPMSSCSEPIQIPWKIHIQVEGSMSTNSLPVRIALEPSGRAKSMKKKLDHPKKKVYIKIQ